jgi:methylenetetrahydrofolate dehydrogenase (NADP+)/methenyltetrahydrofolate cyclohydrolase
MEKVLKGFPVSKMILAKLKEEISHFSAIPRLAIIQAGSDPASDFYISNLISKSKKVGIDCKLFFEKPTITQSELIQFIERLNEDSSVHGIMVQKPLPKQIRENEVNHVIKHTKDVDGFHPINLGKLLLEEDGLVPCTAAAVIETCRFYGISLTGKHVVILGRSSIVGKPLANLLLHKSEFGNATVTICHSQTKNIENMMKQADVLVAAIGKANFVLPEMLKKNVIILDVGINEIEDDAGSKIYTGDVDYKLSYDKALAITPVPNGIGSVTTALLLRNVLLAYKNAKI